MPLFIGNNDRQEAINHGTNGEQKSWDIAQMVALIKLPLSGSGVLPQNDNFLTITPFAICVGNYPLASSA